MKKQQAFKNLVKHFGKPQRSHLFPLFNYFFVPQTMAQFKRWQKENCSLLLFPETEMKLIADFFPKAEFKPTKSKRLVRLINMNEFVNEVKTQLNN